MICARNLNIMGKSGLYNSFITKYQTFLLTIHSSCYCDDDDDDDGSGGGDVGGVCVCIDQKTILNVIFQEPLSFFFF